MSTLTYAAAQPTIGYLVGHYNANVTAYHIYVIDWHVTTYLVGVQSKV
jgi:hypothetical protein